MNPGGTKTFLLLPSCPTLGQQISPLHLRALLWGRNSSGGIPEAVGLAGAGGDLCIQQQQGRPRLHYWSLCKMCWDSFVDCVDEDLTLPGMLVCCSLSGRKNMALHYNLVKLPFLGNGLTSCRFPWDFIDVCLSAERRVSKGLWNFTWTMITAGDQKSCVFKTNHRRSTKTHRGFPCLINAASPWG